MAGIPGSLGAGVGRWTAVLFLATVAPATAAGITMSSVGAVLTAGDAVAVCLAAAAAGADHAPEESIPQAGTKLEREEAAGPAAAQQKPVRARREDLARSGRRCTTMLRGHRGSPMMR